MIRTRFVFLGLLIGVAAVLISALRPKSDFTQKEQLIMHALFGVLEAIHLQPQELDDSFSNRAFDNFLKSLDASKRFLLADEVDGLRKFENKLDDQIRSVSLDFFEEANTLIENASDRAKRIYGEVIQEEIDVHADESLELDPDKKSFPQTEAELKASWRKMIKRQMVAKIDRHLERQEKAADSTARKSLEELVLKAKNDTKDQMDDWFTRMERVRRSDRFEAYLTNFAELYDPHSGYFSPKEKQDYDIRIGGRLEGIGARLQQDDEYVKVAMIVPGGPAWKGKELEVDDLIMMATEKGEDPVDLMGMRVDDAVQYIRGPKGTTVILTVKKVDGTVQDIAIRRDEVIIDATFARSVILDLDQDVHDIGYIKLPSFYSTFDGGNSCAADVAKEIEKLKEENVNGIILDLRYNGGGSLPDVVNMTGLFIEEGPVVQVKARGQKPLVHEDEDKSVTYDGPLIVLVNSISASASEILAAALQDYQRAVIVGGKSTFGKGTVQRFFDLDRAVRGKNDMKPLGQVKMTIQKFYRVDGGSTQLRGVVPDIILPDQFSHIDIGERESPSALGWSEIKAVDHDQEVYHVPELTSIKQKSRARIEADSVFQMINKRAIMAQQMEELSLIPLGLQAYRDEMDRRDEEAQRFDDLMTQDIDGLMVATLEADQAYLAVDSSRIARQEDWIGQVKKDVYLKESLLIMRDLMAEDEYVNR